MGKPRMLACAAAVFLWVKSHHMQFKNYPSCSSVKTMFSLSVSSKPLQCPRESNVTATLTPSGWDHVYAMCRCKWEKPIYSTSQMKLISCSKVSCLETQNLGTSQRGKQDALRFLDMGLFHKHEVFTEITGTWEYCNLALPKPQTTQAKQCWLVT